MADSNITKRALAISLKELMAEQPFDKINVAQICERCDMNRKSFYYHFKDKYDLVNWIFDTEFIALLKDENLDVSHSNYKERWAVMEKICRYFYQNHGFYRKALQIKGQNSFRDHFREYIQPHFRALWTGTDGSIYHGLFYRRGALCHGAVADDKGMSAAGTVPGKAQSAYGRRGPLHLPGVVSGGAGIPVISLAGLNSLLHKQIKRESVPHRDCGTLSRLLIWKEPARILDRRAE